jgi:hypothetical protein
MRTQNSLPLGKKSKLLNTFFISLYNLQKLDILLQSPYLLGCEVYGKTLYCQPTRATIMSDQDNFPGYDDNDAGLQQAIRNSLQSVTLKTGALYRRARNANNQPIVHQLSVRPRWHKHHSQTIAMNVIGMLPDGNCPVHGFAAGFNKQLRDNDAYVDSFLQHNLFDQIKPYLIGNIDAIENALLELRDYRDDLSPHINRFINFLTHYHNNLTAERFLQFIREEIAGRAQLAALQVALQPALRAYAEALDKQHSQHDVERGLLSKAEQQKNLAEHGNAVHTGPTLITRLANALGIHVCYLSLEDNPAKGHEVGLIDDSYYDHTLPTGKLNEEDAFEQHYNERLAENEPTIYLLYTESKNHFDLAVPEAEFNDNSTYQCADADFDDVLSAINAAALELHIKINQQVSDTLDVIDGNNTALVAQLIEAASELYEEMSEKLNILKIDMLDQLEDGTITTTAAIAAIKTASNHKNDELSYTPQHIIAALQGKLAKQKATFFYHRSNDCKPLDAPALPAEASRVACA